MSRGRKKIVANNSDWESVFYNSVGTYVQYINLKLAEHIKAEPLSNHIRIAGGYAFKSSDYKKQGVPVIRISDFSNEKIVLDDVVYYDESEDLKRYELNEGDIVIALTGGTIAKLGIVQKGIGKLYLNQRVGKFEVLHPEEFETEYVYWIARSVQSIIKNLAWGAAIPNVSPKQIEELQFPIPDKETQNGIIDFLNDLRANKIADDREYFNSEVEDFVFLLQANQISGSELQSELTYQQDLMKQLRQAFLKEAMQGKLVKQNPEDGTAIELLEKIKADKEILIEEKKIRKEKQLPLINEEEIPFDIPKSWIWCRLGEVCFKITDGFHNTPPKITEGFPYIAATHVKSDKIDWENCNYVEEKYHRELFIKAYPQKGELLVVNIGAGCGTPAIIDVDFEFSFKNTAILKFNQSLTSNKFLFYYFLLRKDEIYSTLAKGGLQPFLSLKILNEIYFPLPPFDEQKRIANKLEEVMKLCDEVLESINQSKTEIESLIKTLLNDALGVATIYDVTKDKTLKEKVKKFYTDGDTFKTMSMKIIEILQTSNEPISATVVWNSSEYSKDIETFYAELKRLIDIEKLVVEEKRGKESFLKLAVNEN